MDRNPPDRRNKRGGLLKPSCVLAVCAALSCAGCGWLDRIRGERNAQCDQLRREARTAWKDGDLHRASELLDRAIAANPEDPETRRQRAELLWENEHFEASLAELERIVAANPADLDALTRLARAEYELGRDESAARHAAAALRLDPADLEALLLTARLQARRRDYEAALASFHRVTQIDAENVDAALGIAAVQIERGSPEQASPWLRNVLQNPWARDEQRTEAAWRLGLAYAQLERWHDAVASLASVIDERPPSGDDRYRLAYARLKSGDADGARRDLEQALQLDPGHREAQALASNMLGPRQTPAARGGQVLPAGGDDRQFD